MTPELLEFSDMVLATHNSLNAFFEPFELQSCDKQSLASCGEHWIEGVVKFLFGWMGL